MVTVRVNERCLALKNGIAYEYATVLKVNKMTARVRYPKGDEKISSNIDCSYVEEGIQTFSKSISRTHGHRPLATPI